MIVYENKLWGLPTLLQVHGSAFPRALLFASVCAIVTAMLYKFGPDATTGAIRNPVMYQIFAFVVGFSVVFRWVGLLEVAWS